MDVDRERFITLCEDLDIQPHPNYSGRGMYGKTCIGIATRTNDKFVQFLLQVAPQLDPKFEWVDGELDYDHAWGRLDQDQLGHDTIWFWPNIRAVADSE